MPGSSVAVRNVRPLLRVDLRSPTEDYKPLRELGLDQGTLACHRKNRPRLTVIRKSFSPSPLQMLEAVAQIKHPNIADIFDVYFYDGQLFVVTEYLDASLLDLEFTRLAAAEWEVATVVTEVIKAMAYLLDTLPNSEIHIDSVRLSLGGDVKLSPDHHYQNSQDEIFDTRQQCNSAFISTILEILMPHEAPRDKPWSRDALEFAAIPQSDSLLPFIGHVFLGKAVSSSKLVPRIRLALQMRGCQSPICAVSTPYLSDGNDGDRPF